MGKISLILITAIVVLASCAHKRKNIQDNNVPKKEYSEENLPTDYKSAIKKLTAETFRQKIMDYAKHPQKWVFEGTRPAIVDFYATWCGPCKMTAPVLEELAIENKGKIDFYKVDIDQERELAEIFGIQSIPTFLFVPIKGEPTFQMGAMQKSDFEEIIDSRLLKR